MSIRDTILAAKDITDTMVEVPEWGVTVRVVGMNVGERNEMIGEVRDAETGETDINKFYLLVAQSCTYDPETGERVFTLDDVPALAKKSPAAIDRLTKAALAASGLDEKGDIQNAVEKAGKGSSSTRSGASSSK